MQKQTLILLVIITGVNCLSCSEMRKPDFWDMITGRHSQVQMAINSCYAKERELAKRKNDEILQKKLQEDMFAREKEREKEREKVRETRWKYDSYKPIEIPPSEPLSSYKPPKLVHEPIILVNNPRDPMEIRVPPLNLNIEVNFPLMELI